MGRVDIEKMKKSIKTSCTIVAIYWQLSISFGSIFFVFLVSTRLIGSIFSNSHFVIHLTEKVITVTLL